MMRRLTALVAVILAATTTARSPCLAYARWADGTEKLYDPGADPFELTNLASVAGRWPGDPSRAADLDAVRANLDELVAAL
jgi:hypothetical protein